MQRRLSPEEASELVGAYKRGRTLKELVTTFGVHRNTVIAHLDREGVPRRRQPTLSEDEVVEASRLYASGDSLALIGKRLGFDPKTVRKALAEVGVSIRPSNRNRRGRP